MFAGISDNVVFSSVVTSLASHHTVIYEPAPNPPPPQVALNEVILFDVSVYFPTASNLSGISLIPVPLSIQ